MENNYAVIKVEAAPARLVNWYATKTKTVLTSFGFKEVEIEVPATLKEQEDIDDKVRIYTAKLTFNARKKLNTLYNNVRTGNWAFRITTADGTKFLIGRSSRPMPVTKCTRNLSDEKSNQMYQYDVQWKTTHPLPIL